MFEFFGFQPMQIKTSIIFGTDYYFIFGSVYIGINITAMMDAIQEDLALRVNNDDNKRSEPGTKNVFLIKLRTFFLTFHIFKNIFWFLGAAPNGMLVSPKRRFSIAPSAVSSVLNTQRRRLSKQLQSLGIPSRKTETEEDGVRPVKVHSNQGDVVWSLVSHESSPALVKATNGLDIAKSLLQRDRIQNPVPVLEPWPILPSNANSIIVHENQKMFFSMQSYETFSLFG